MAKLITTQYGGLDRTSAAIRYLTKDTRFPMKRWNVTTDIGTEELVHVEIV